MASNSVRKLSHVSFHADGEAWPFARDHRLAIDRHWQKAIAQNPKFFNGTIFLMTAFEVAGDTARGRFLRTDFKSYLYWRESGWPDAGVLDGFGSALVKTRDGGILLARQNAGHINAGLVYLPGGFIDERDVTADETIDLTRSVSRELFEETGLGPDVVQAMPGFYVTECRPQISFAVAYQANLTPESLKRRVEAFLAAGHDNELSDVIVAHGLAGIAHLNVAPYARLLLSALFEGL